jgi:membrane associated rhomboid family serine protease
MPVPHPPPVEIDSAASLPSRRTGADRWTLVRRLVLPYRTQRALESGWKPARNQSYTLSLGAVAVTVHDIVRDPSRRSIARSIQYGCSLDGFARQLLDECHVAWTRAKGSGRRRAPFFVVALAYAITVIFFYMAAEWAGSSTAFAKKGPAALAFYWRPGTCVTEFSADFMDAWGSRSTLQILQGGWWRWVSAAFLHVSLRHLVSNTVALALFGVPLERRFGTLFVGACWFVAALCGNVESTLFEEKHVAIAGASGGVFGLFGATCVHLVREYSRLRAPLLRCLLVALTVLQLGSQFVNEPYISHGAHVFGALNGAVFYAAHTRCRYAHATTAVAAVAFVVALAVFYT